MASLNFIDKYWLRSKYSFQLEIWVMAMKTLILVPNIRDMEEITEKSGVLTMDEKDKYTNTSPLDTHLDKNFI